MSARSYALWLLMLALWVGWVIAWPVRALWRGLRTLWARANGETMEDDWNGEDDWR